MLTLKFMTHVVLDHVTRASAINAGLVPALARILRLDSARIRLIEMSAVILATIANHEVSAAEFKEHRIKPILEGLSCSS